MEFYGQILKYLNIDNNIVEITNGETKIPYPGVDQPFLNYGFPPALIPLWSESSGPKYFGLWKHWFSNRQMSIVKYSLETLKIEEIARNIPQLIRIIALESICVFAGINQQLIDFSKVHGVNLLELQLIDELSLEKGDEHHSLKDLPQFGSESPVNFFTDKDDYKGDFPFKNKKWDKESLRQVCSLELDKKELKKLSKLDYSPLWLKNWNQVEIFEELLSEGDLNGAWMSLNSSNWKFSEAKEALKKLSDEANDEVIYLLSNAWDSLPDQSLTLGY